MIAAYRNLNSNCLRVGRRSRCGEVSVFSKIVLFATIGLLMLSFCGCQRWPGTQAMRQYQLESDRLLSEFRSQKKRADDLEVRNLQLEQRLAESEKQIARIQGRGSNSRIASRGNNTELKIGEPSGDLADVVSDSNSSRNSPPKKRNGLPDVIPGTPGYLTGSSGGDRRNLKGDPANSDDWRPFNRR